MPPRVVAIIATYNEERFIGGCLEHLFANGVQAYVCDNESTDRTVRKAAVVRLPRCRVLVERRPLSAAGVFARTGARSGPRSTGTKNVG
jgi:glycosyltransferase involved in cell wall biosynthesis